MLKRLETTITIEGRGYWVDPKRVRPPNKRGGEQRVECFARPFAIGAPDRLVPISAVPSYLFDASQGVAI